MDFGQFSLQKYNPLSFELKLDIFSKPLKIIYNTETSNRDGICASWG
jgi:hypothetical protein